MPILFGNVLYSIHMKFIWADWVSKIDWVLLKVEVPKDVEHGPKNMEQFLASLWGGIWGSGSGEDKVLKGKIREWVTLEVESNGGIVNFYIRIRRSFINLIHSSLYAQYPDIVITEADDYTKEVPDNLPDDKYDIFGTDFCLSKEDAYPIRTYLDFKDELAQVSTSSGPGGLLNATGSWIDPMSSLVEAMAAVRPSDRAWLHISIRPESDVWKGEALKVRDQLIERVQADNPSAFKQFVDDASAVSKNVAGEVASVYTMGSGIESTFPDHAPENKESKMQRQDVTPGESEIVQAIERSVDKLGFKTEFRACHIGLKDPPDMAFAGIFGAIHQFNTQNYNGFEFRFDTGTKMGAYIFLSNFRMTMRKHRLLELFKTREFPHLDKDNRALGILNVEELATIFHFPATFVQTPQIGRAETRKAAPPLDLPIVE